MVRMMAAAQEGLEDLQEVKEARLSDVAKLVLERFKMEEDYKNADPSSSAT